MKAAVLSKALRQHHTEVLVHTGQHYDDLMSEIFFRELAMAAPDVNLSVGSGSPAQQTARMLEGIEAVLLEQAPDCVLVYGDTTSTLAGALAAAKLNLPLAHIEAGLRSYNRAMPEEVNRVLTDHVARYLFCPTANAAHCLALEGITAGVYLVGDLMYDSLMASLPLAMKASATVLAEHGLAEGGFYLATIHRQSNTDDWATLASLITALGLLDLPVVLPLHPRTRAALFQANISVPKGVLAIDPVGYLEMLALEVSARAILTDSGGVQREAYFLAVPCVTLREESEWPETLAEDWNVLAGANVEKIVAAARRPRPQNPPPHAFGDGKAADKIVEILESDPPHGHR